MWLGSTCRKSVDDLAQPVRGQELRQVGSDDPDASATLPSSAATANTPHVEDRIRDDKDTGLAKFPFKEFQLNEVWLQIVLFAHDLMVWTQALLLSGELQTAEPKRLRYRSCTSPAGSRSTAAADGCDCNTTGHGPPNSPPRSASSKRSRPPAADTGRLPTAPPRRLPAVYAQHGKRTGEKASESRQNPARLDCSTTTAERRSSAEPTSPGIARARSAIASARPTGYTR